MGTGLIVSSERAGSEEAGVLAVLTQDNPG